MTVKVIKPPPTFETITVVCHHCATVFSADSADDFARVSGSDQRDGDSWDYAVVPCPTCGSHIQISSERFPAHVYSKLKRR